MALRIGFTRECHRFQRLPLLTDSVSPLSLEPRRTKTPAVLNDCDFTSECSVETVNTGNSRKSTGLSLHCPFRQRPAFTGHSQSFPPSLPTLLASIITFFLLPKVTLQPNPLASEWPTFPEPLLFL